MRVDGFVGVKKLSVIFFISALALVGVQGCSDKADSIATIVSSDCWIDSINDKSSSIVEVKPGIISFRGWAADSSTGTAPKEMGIYIADSKGNKVLFKADKRVSRADVAAAKKKPAYKMSGFYFSADASTLPAGEHTLSVVMYRDDAKISCATPKKLVVK